MSESNPGQLPAALNLRIKSPQPRQNGNTALCSALPVRTVRSAFAAPSPVDRSGAVPGAAGPCRDIRANDEQTASRSDRASAGLSAPTRRHSGQLVERAAGFPTVVAPLMSLLIRCRQDVH
jgi:hypothetical protein